MQKELALLTLSNLSLSADGRLAIGAAGGMKAATQLLQTEQQQPEVQVQSAYAFAVVVCLFRIKKFVLCV